MRKRERLDSNWNNNFWPFSDSQAQEGNPEKLYTSEVTRIWSYITQRLLFDVENPHMVENGGQWPQQDTLTLVRSFFHRIINWKEGEWEHEHLESKYNSSFCSFSDKWTKRNWAREGWEERWGRVLAIWQHGRVSFADFRKSGTRAWGCYSRWSELRDPAGAIDDMTHKIIFTIFSVSTLSWSPLQLRWGHLPASRLWAASPEEKPPSIPHIPKVKLNH